jgi:AraC-like DNA-binding protein
MEAYRKIYLYQRIVQAKLFIDRHFAEPIDLDNIADEAYFSRFHFIRLFRSAYGHTPHRYLVRVRICHAEQLLARGLSVSDASIRVGFESPTSFTAAFKKFTGKTPSRFQTEQRLKEQLVRRNPLALVPGCFAETHGWTKNAISES